MKLTKIIFLLCIGGIVSCKEVELPIPPPISVVESIFTTKETRVNDGQNINFDLPTDGVYILTLIDTETDQVVSRERFSGKSGRNTKRIYTKSIQSRYLYLILLNENKVELNKTKLVLE